MFFFKLVPHVNKVKLLLDLGFQKELLEFWKSCCQGNFSLTTSGKILRLELELGYGMDVRLKHYDVAHKGFLYLKSYIYSIFYKNRD